MQPHARLSKRRLVNGNEIATHYQSLYLRLFSEVHDVRHPNHKHTSTDGVGFKYDLYVPRQELGSSDTEVLRRYPELRNYHYGEIENDLLEFVLGEINDPVLSLVGGVGYGKTTLLRYIVDYLAINVEPLSKKVSFVFVDCFHYRTSLLGSDTRVEVSVASFLNDHIDKAVAARLHETASPDNDAFWKLARDFNGFHALRDAENDARLTLSETTAITEIRARRKQERQRTQFYLQCCQYYAATDRVLVLILDNVDALTGAGQAAVMDFAREFASRHACRVIVPMRDATWRNMFSQQHDHIRPLSLKLPPPILRDILRSRTEVFVKAIECSKDAPQLNIRGKRIEVPDTAAALQRLHGYLLTEEVNAALEILAQGNLRRALSLAGRYYRSGRLRTSNFLAPLLDLPPEVIPPVPTWLFWEAILMGTRGTFMTEHAAPGLVNVWSNGTSASPFSHFVKLLVLNRLRTAALPSGVLLDEARLLIPDYAETGGEQVRHAIFDMLNNGLLESPDVYQYENIREIRSEHRLGLSAVGLYYLDEISWDFTYVSLVKDDVYLNTRTELYQTVPEAPAIKDRYKETIKFVEYLKEQEDRVTGLRGPEAENAQMTKWRSGLTGAGITHKLCRSLIKFGNSHRLPHELVNRLGTLEKDLLESKSDTR